jgi:membrane associated rhomboid family serine protease
LLIWIFAREAWHIGASGLLYGLLGFLFFSGIFRRDRRSVALALLVIFLYGGFVWGILPLSREISWEAHLFGGISGILASFLFRKDDPYIGYEWEEEDTETVNDGEINKL